MKMMKAVVMTGPNKPWQVQDVPVPVIEAGQVLVKVHASGMCYTDVWATQGYGGDIYPQTPGHEVVGEVVEWAPACTRAEWAIAWAPRGSSPPAGVVPTAARTVPCPDRRR